MFASVVSRSVVLGWEDALRHCRGGKQNGDSVTTGILQTKRSRQTEEQRRHT